MEKADKRHWGSSRLNLVEKIKIFAVGTAMTSVIALASEYYQNRNFDDRLLVVGLISLVCGTYVLASSKNFYE